ncbi:MAG: DUF2029 domain-containing protein [Lachnospiraceae bacterium]|nr:DUF2029 domain-containing protein [Lachnospiraceae bacterium]
MKNIMNSKKFYEKAFVLSLGFLIMSWIFLIFKQGIVSSQRALFFCDLGDFWADCMNVVGYSSLLDPYNNTMYTGFEEKGYPPLVYLLMYLPSRLVDMQSYYNANYFKNMYMDPLFLIFAVAFLIVVYIIAFELIRFGKNGSSIIKIITAATILLSGPMLFTFERGNIIILVPFLLLSFILFHGSDNKIVKEIGLICLALAAGIKLTPAILGILLLIEKKWKDTIRTVLYGILFCFGPFFFLKGGLFSNLPLMLRNLSMLMDKYKDAEGCTVRNLFRKAEGVLSLQETSGTVITIVSIVIGLFLIICAYSSDKIWEKVMALCLIFTTLPNYSGYYCLIYMIPPLILFLNEERHERVDLAILMSFILIFNPVQSSLKSYGFNYHFGVFVILLVMIFKVLCYGYKRIKCGEKVNG